MKKLKYAILVGIIFCFLYTCLRALIIGGPSMSPTLLWNDFVISNQVAYDFRFPFTNYVLYEHSDPNRGDVVVYFDTNKNLIAVKRIIGIPGDKIEINENQIFVNKVSLTQKKLERNLFEDIPAENGIGELVLEEELDGKKYVITFSSNSSELSTINLVEVTSDHYFILGDHRDNSADSRYIGLINRSQIKGRIIYGLRENGLLH